jgi:flavin reductase (DIM6/NTAB) family NADH-FMN oxidoreductase RutF
MDIKVLNNLTYGVYIVGTLNGSKSTGCVANSAMQVTATPPTVAVSIHHDNFTNECIKKSKIFSLSILSEDSSPSIIAGFGFSSGKDRDKFAKCESKIISGAPIVTDACGGIVCKLIDSMESPTHTVFLGEVIDTISFGDKVPMTYAYYHNVIKGKSPKTAPTYIPEDKKQ